MRDNTLSEEDKKALNQLTGIDAEKYLSLYVGDIDWSPVLQGLRSLNISLEEKWKRIAFAIVLPTHEQTPFKNADLTNLFNWCFKWQQYNSRNWIAELKDIYLKDQKIEPIRNKCLDLGVVYPLHYNPTTRQAFNWLIEKAKDNANTEDMTIASEKLQNLVYVYGGKVVCGVFEKLELSAKIDKLPHWRSGYFFERLIHEAYTEQQILDLKMHEINKLKNSGSNLIKYINKEASNGNS